MSILYKRHVVLAMALLVSATAPAQQERTDSAPGFGAFELLIQRNIFDPERRAAVAETYESREEAAPPPEERLNLTGVVIQNETAVAFFEGTDSAFNANLEKGDVVAGFRITAIGTDGVALTRDERTIDLPVGSALARQGESEWTAAEAKPTGDPWAALDDMFAGGDKESAADEGGASDVLKRMRERRQQELKR